MTNLYHFRFLTSDGLLQEKHETFDEHGSLVEGSGELLTVSSSYSYSEVTNKEKKGSYDTGKVVSEKTTTFSTPTTTENVMETTTEQFFEYQNVSIVPQVGSSVIATLAGGGLG